MDAVRLIENARVVDDGSDGDGMRIGKVERK